MVGLADASINAAYDAGVNDGKQGCKFDWMFTDYGADTVSYAVGYLATVALTDPTLQDSIAYARSVVGDDEVSNPVDVDYTEPCIQ